ncbi:MAG TPA: hypothetical protein VHF88_03650 [Thermoleophilaceae bacterium]|nr:hypothetical protein [Thermoleophilaceae bacterium]
MNRSRRPRDRLAQVRAPRRLLSLSSDDRLVERVIDGDDTAFELLYARHVADALAFAAGVLGSQEEAEEAVRHSFAAAHAYLAGGGRRTAFEPWLYAILENHCLSVLQQRAPEPDGPERLATVVDLDEWRRRRRRLIGVGLPFAPSAAFHDSVMSACGIGAGTATVAAPLLGGTMAKVAVVAVLAGGAGIAGTTASGGDPAGSGTGSSGPPPVADIAEQQRPRGDDSGLHPELPVPLAALDERAAARGPSASFPDRLHRNRDRPVPPADTALRPIANAPNDAPSSAVPGGYVERGDDAGVPPATGTPNVPLDVPALSAPDGPARLPLTEGVKERVPRVVERVKARLPAPRRPPKVTSPEAVKPPPVDLPTVAKPPRLELPDVGKLPKVRDDGGVIPVKPSAAVGTLLTGGADAPLR